MNGKLKVLALVCAVFVLPFCGPEAAADFSGGVPMGLPIGGGSEEPDTELCPAGFHVVNTFLSAWEKKDYATMYDLLDEDSKRDYSFEQARFDFRLLAFKPYRISSVREDGENFEFMLSYGSWKDGNKDLKKMIINGKTYKIIMPTRNSPFKKSAADYF